MSITAEAEAEVCFETESKIDVVKLTNDQDVDAAPGFSLVVGSPVTWTYRVTNLVVTTLTGVAVSDDKEGDISAPAGFDGTLAPGESVTFTATGVAVAGQYRNVGTATASNPAGETVSGEDTSWYTGMERPILPNTGAVAPAFDLFSGWWANR